MQDPTGSSSDETGELQYFHLRTVTGSSGSNTIVLQNKNGPCALVAITNTLVLEDTPTAAFIRESEKGHNRIDEEALKAHLGEVAGNRTTTPEFFTVLAEYLPKLTRGLDVNPKFDGTFDATPEMQVFASFDIPLVHGWVLGDVEREEFDIADTNLSKMSYEEFCEKQFSDSPNTKLGLFVETYRSQLTISGFMRLLDTVPKNSFAVLFWNNHFSTLLNHQGQLLILATDLGYQSRPEIVWEVLEPSGAGQYLNGNFEPSDQQLSRDAELAKQLDQEERAKSNSTAHRKVGTPGLDDASLDDAHTESISKSMDSRSLKPKHASSDRRRPHMNSSTHSSKAAGPTKKKKQGDRCVLM